MPAASHRSEGREEQLSPNAVGRELGITGEAVKQWIYLRKLKARKLPNGYWRISRADLDSFLRSKQEGAPRGVLLVGALAAEMSGALAEAGWNVETAPNATDAVLRAPGSHPAAIVIDVHSLGQGGWKAAGKLRQTRGTKMVPIVLIGSGDTGNDPGILDQAVSIGAQRFLTAPLDREDFLGVIDRLAGDPARPKKYTRRLDA